MITLLYHCKASTTATYSIDTRKGDILTVLVLIIYCTCKVSVTFLLIRGDTAQYRKYCAAFGISKRKNVEYFCVWLGALI